MRNDLHIISHVCQEYAESVAEQERGVAAILADAAHSALIFTEHPPVYTIGTSGSQQDVLMREINGEKIRVVETGRGGEVTYHGPGQLVCYALIDIRHAPDLHRHVWRLEEMVIRTLADFGIEAGRNERGIGVWVDDKKIAAVGVRCRKWVTYHGIALNIDPDMAHFRGIVTCGMADQPVVSMRQLGVRPSRAEVEQRMAVHAGDIFNRAGER